MVFNNFEWAKSKISNDIDNTIIYYYGEKKWNSMSLKERNNIIEDIVRDKASYYNLSESEIKKILQNEWSKEA